MKSHKTRTTKIEECYIVEISEEERKRNYEVSDEFHKQFAEYIALAVRNKLIKAKSKTATSATQEVKLVKI